MRRSAIARITALAVVLVLTSIASSRAQSVDLVCGGTMIQHEPSRTEGNVPPGATRIDFSNSAISTPVGNFRISKVEDTQIFFDDPRSTLKVFGQLDRMTGLMTVTWMRPEEAAKLAAQLTAKMAMQVDLRCTAGRRLF